jgi:hypothetical protein
MHVTPHERGVRAALAGSRPRGIAATRGIPERCVFPFPTPHGGVFGQKRGGRTCRSRDDRDGPGAAEADRPSTENRRRKPAGNGRRTLKGNIEAHGRVGHRASATPHGGTDPNAEQSLEGELDAGCVLNGGSGNANPGGASSAESERQEGKGRGDTVRLRSGGILRGVRSVAGKGRSAWQQEDRTGNAANPTIGSGMQQARDSRTPRGVVLLTEKGGGASRRGGAKPRGRNGTPGLVGQGPKVRWRHRAGSGRRRACRWRGDWSPESGLCSNVRGVDRARRIPGEAVVEPTGARICSSEGERRPRVLGLHARTPRGDRA